MSREDIMNLADENDNEECYEDAVTSQDRFVYKYLQNITLSPEAQEVLDMAKAYKHPELCNYYCTHECAIGKRDISPIDAKKNIATITLEILSAMNYLDDQKNRLVDITQDEHLTEDEYEDMKKIRDRLKKMAGSIANLQLWVDQQLEQEN
jgi:glutamine synthetase type III